MFAYNREFLLIDAYTRVYDRVFDASYRAEYDCLAAAEHPQILRAEIFSKKEEKIQLVYEHSQKTMVPLFTGFLESAERGHKRRGNYFTYFSYSERLSMVLLLCDLFDELDRLQIPIRYPSDDLLLWDTQEKMLYLDLLPAILVRTAENQAKEYRMNQEYYWPLLPESAFEGSFSCRYTGEVRNRILLNLLVFRLMTGEDWYNWTSREGDVLPEPEVRRAVGGPVKESFYDVLCELTQKRFGQRDLRQVPTSEFWRTAIASQQRCLCGQFLTPGECRNCGRTKIGEVTAESTGKTLPLLVPNADYKASDFELEGETVQMRIRRRMTEDGEETAVFFGCGHPLYYLDGDTKKTWKTTNSSGTYSMFFLGKGKNVTLEYCGETYCITMD